jgi:diadenosine tetraphosphate (Ap4A) HIT family hydrolase
VKEGIVPKCILWFVFSKVSQMAKRLRDTTAVDPDSKMHTHDREIGQLPHHAHLHVIPRFDDEPLADRGGRSAIKAPENRRPDPWRPGNGRARSFVPEAQATTR